jgi:hypothetical protein
MSRFVISLPAIVEIVPTGRASAAFTECVLFDSDGYGLISAARRDLSFSSRTLRSSIFGSVAGIFCVIGSSQYVYYDSKKYSNIQYPNRLCWDINKVIIY